MNTNSKLMQEIDKMSVMDLAKLVASLQVALGQPVTAYQSQRTEVATDGTTVATGPSKNSFTVNADSVPMEKKMGAIKAVREVLGIGLKEAKDFVDGLPKVVAEDVDKAKADELQKKLTDAGIVVSVK